MFERKNGDALSNMRKGHILSNIIRKEDLSLFIFSVFYYGIIIFLSGYLNVWEDEVYSLNTSSNSLRYACHQSIFFEAQPPIYFIILTLWRFISDSILWARLLNLFFIVLSQFFMFQFLKKVSDRKIATISSFFFLMNPVTVFTLLEIRLFALVILLSLGIIICFYYTYYLGRITLVCRFIFILLALIALFTQYYLGSLLFAIAVVLLVKKNKKFFWIYILDMVIPLFLILLVIPMILQLADVQNTVIPSYNRTSLDFFDEVKRLFSQVTFTYFLPTYFIKIKIIEWILRGVVIVLLISSFGYVEIKKNIRSNYSFFVISLIIFLFFVLVTYEFGKYSSEYKYTIVLFIPLYISLVILFKPIRQRLLNCSLIILALIYLSANFEKYHELYKNKDYRSLGNYLEKNEKDGEPTFVYRNISAENLDIYYNGINVIIPVPRAFSYYNKFSPAQWELGKEDICDLGKKLSKYPQFNIVIDNTPLSGFNASKKVLTDYLFSNFSMEYEKLFNKGITLYRFSQKAALHD